MCGQGGIEGTRGTGDTSGNANTYPLPPLGWWLSGVAHLQLEVPLRGHLTSCRPNWHLRDSSSPGGRGPPQSTHAGANGGGHLGHVAAAPRDDGGAAAVAPAGVHSVHHRLGLLRMDRAAQRLRTLCRVRRRAGAPQPPASGFRRFGIWLRRLLRGFVRERTSRPPAGSSQRARQ